MYELQNIEETDVVGPLLGNVVVAPGGEVAMNYKRCVPSPDLQLLYIEVPKVACTSIKKAMVDAFDIDQATFEQWKLGFIPWVNFDEVPRDSVFVFSFVRNPFDRLVSAYEDKFNHDEPQDFNRELMLAAFEALGVDRLQFSDFVDLIEKFPDHLSNLHWKSQYHFVTGKELRPMCDVLGRFEDLQGGIELVSKRIGRAFELPLHAES